MTFDPPVVLKDETGVPSERSEGRVFKQDDGGSAGQAGRPGGPEGSDPRVNIPVRARAPGQVGAGRRGEDQRQRRRPEPRRGRCRRGRRQGEGRRSDDGSYGGYSLDGSRFCRERPVLGGDLLTGGGLLQPVGGAVVEAAVLQGVSRPGQPEPGTRTRPETAGP